MRRDIRRPHQPAPPEQAAARGAPNANIGEEEPLEGHMRHVWLALLMDSAVLRNPSGQNEGPESGREMMLDTIATASSMMESGRDEPGDNFYR
jgi:hypothetical protein